MGLYVHTVHYTHPYIIYKSILYTTLAKCCNLSFPRCNGIAIEQGFHFACVWVYICVYSFNLLIVGREFETWVMVYIGVPYNTPPYIQSCRFYKHLSHIFLVRSHPLLWLILMLLPIKFKKLRYYTVSILCHTL